MGRKRKSVTSGTDIDAMNIVSNSSEEQNWLTLLKTDRILQSVFILTFAGLILRFYNLGYNSLWLDEATTLTYARRSFGDILMSGVGGGGEFNAPLFYWMEHFMVFFGESEFILRFLPALLGTLTIPLFYLVGKELIDRQTGLIAVALLFISPFHIYYSQEARAYVPEFFFFTLAVWLFLVSRRNNRLYEWAFFAFSASASIWMNYYYFVPVGFLVLYHLGMNRDDFIKRSKNCLPFLVGVVTLSVLTLPLVFAGLRLFGGLNVKVGLLGYSGLPLITESLTHLLGFNSLIALLLIILFILGIIGLISSKRDAGYFIVGLFAFQLGVSLLLASSMPMMPRYQFVLMLPLLLGIASVFRLIPKEFKSPHIISVMVIIVCLINVPFLSGYYTSYSKNDWRGFSVTFSELTNSGDIVVLVPGYMRQPFNYYYSNSTDDTIQFGVTTQKELEVIRLAHQDKRIFFIVTGDLFAAEPTGQSYAWLEEKTQYAGSHTGIHVFFINSE